MTNNKSTKRALLSSALSLFLCFAMLLGTTFAWFTDSVTSANNVIQSGNLDIELEYWTGTEWNDVAGATDILTNTLWEPGATEVAYFRIANAGSLALKYQFGVNIISETPAINVEGKPFKLSDYIFFNVVDNLTVDSTTKAPDVYDRAEADAIIESGKTTALKISAGYNPTGTLLSGAEIYLAMVVYMPTSVGNAANHNGVAPKIDLGINIIATQVANEEDSFGPDYDDGAFIPTAPETIPDGDVSGDTILTGSVETNGLTVKVPANVVNSFANTVTSMSIAASAPVIDTANKTVTFSTMELQDQNGKEIDLSNSTSKVTVTLPVGDAFANGETVEVYHDGSFVTYATVENGYISYEVSHFCEVTVKSAEEVKLDNTIDSVKEFIAFANAVNAGNSYMGQIVVLGADLDLNGVTWTPIGTSANPFKGTFDGNGKVIKNLSVLMAGKSNVGLFGYTTDGEIKNVTVENAKVAGRLNVGVVAGTPYTSKYTNITVKGHVEVDGMAYVGGVAGKNAYANWTDVTVTVDATSYVNANSVENGKAYRTYVGGVIGFMGEGGHTVSNVTSNIDVFGSTIDVGGIVGIAHYGNKFENITCSGKVEIYAAAEAADAEEMGGIAGVWHNENGTSVSFTDCTFNGKLTANVAADLYNNTIVGAAYNTTGNGTLVIDGKSYVAVNTADELVEALEKKQNVIFVNNIKIEPANMSNAYGTTGINVKYGQTIDGNGYTLNIKGAGGTWDSGINTTGGIIKNITVTGSFRGIFINHNSSHSEKVVLDNVTLTGVTYTISCDQGLYQGIEATNCKFYGWTSFAKTAGEAKFVDCYFGKGNGYAYCRPYSNTEFVNCAFSAGYAVDETRANVTFTDCVWNNVSNAAELTTALTKGGEYTVVADFALTKRVEVPAGVTVVLDMNGYTVNGTLSGTGNQDLFLVKGNLTVNNGSITLAATVNQGWNAMSSIFDITAGGVVTLDTVVADNLGGTDMNFVAHLNNWGTASLYAYNSTLKATYTAVRVFNSGYDMNNVTIENSTISTTGNAAFWVHNYTAADFGTQEKADAQAKLLNFQFANNTFEAKKAAFRYGFTNAEYYTADGAKVISTAAELKAALTNGGNFALGADFSVDESLTVPAGVTVVLNLNGYTITGTDNATGSFGLINNKGNLTVNGDGAITLTATNNRAWNAYSSVISNQPGGKLTVNGGNIQHFGGTDMAYGIDNLTNGKGTYAETVVNGGTVKSTYRAIRQFLNGVEAQNILTINGGTIEGANKSVWMQDPSKNSNTGTLTVGANAVLNGDVYLFVTAGSTEWPVEVSIADSAVNGEVITGNVPEGYTVEIVDGVWTVTK